MNASPKFPRVPVTPSFLAILAILGVFDLDGSDRRSQPIEVELFTRQTPAMYLHRTRDGVELRLGPEFRPDRNLGM